MHGAPLPAEAPASAAGVLLVVPRIRAARRDAAEILCGATLIAPDVVLTAAHCTSVHLDQRDGRVMSRQIYFSLQENVAGVMAAQVAGLPNTAQVAETCTHPQFSHQEDGRLVGLGQTHDLAVLRLVAPMLGAPLQPLIGPDQVHELYRRRDVSIVGYGASWGGAAGAGSIGLRRQAASIINALGPFEMQVGAPGRVARRCHGDSGGPTLFLLQGRSFGQEVQVGVGAHTYDEHDCLNGQVDTRVDRYLGWISLLQDLWRQGRRGASCVLEVPVAPRGHGSDPHF